MSFRVCNLSSHRFTVLDICSFHVVRLKSSEAVLIFPHNMNATVVPLRISCQVGCCGSKALQPGGDIDCFSPFVG